MAAAAQENTAASTSGSGIVLAELMADEQPEAVKAGGKVMEINPDVFPEKRPYRDVIFAIAFLIVAGVFAVLAFKETEGFKFDTQDGKHEDLPIACMAKALSASFISSCISAFMFVHFTRMFTKLIVQASLLLSPCLLIIIALACLAGPSPQNMIGAASFGFAGLCSLMCVLCCWKQFIPFTVEVLKPVATVLGHKPSLMFVAVIGTFFSVAWSVLAFSAFFGIFERMQKQNAADKESYYGLYFITALIFAWGALVVQNTCHVTYCGVFGRWYFGLYQSVRSSLNVAAFKSFGSICFGSLIIAFVQACEMTARAMRKDAQNENKLVITVILCCIECFIRCIRDFIEAFTYFAYVQVAVRGVNFIDSAKLTFALCKVNNVFYIVSCSLVGNVVLLGSIFCGIIAGLIAVGVGYATAPHNLSSDSRNSALTFSACFGIALGVVIAATILNILRSGFATICVCWAEQKDKLAVLEPDLCQALQNRCRLSEQGASS